jgi:hypothetical protein
VLAQAKLADGSIVGGVRFFLSREVMSGRGRVRGILFGVILLKNILIKWRARR